MTHTLDYAPLREPLTRVDIENYKQISASKRSSVLIQLLAFLPLIAVLFLFAVILEGGGSFVPVAFPLVIFAGMILMAILTTRFSLRRRAKLYKFASRNNLTLISNKPSPAYHGMIFDNGHSREIDDAFRFQDGTEIGNYTYVTGSGKNKRMHRWGYAKIELSRRLPHMILDARGNNFWKFSNLSDSFNRSQILQLEGDFNNYFTLYAPKQYERDALYVFTPDVMAAMVDYGKNYDIEIVDNHLFIFSNGHFPLEKEEFYQSVLAIIDSIRSEVVDQTSNYADERIGDRRVDMVAAGGQRLKTKFNWIIVVVILIYFYFMFIHPLLLR